MIVENVAAAAMDTEKVFSWQNGNTISEWNKKKQSMDMALSTSDKEWQGLELEQGKMAMMNAWRVKSEHRNQNEPKTTTNNNGEQLNGRTNYGGSDFRNGVIKSGD